MALHSIISVQGTDCPTVATKKDLRIFLAMACIFTLCLLVLAQAVKNHGALELMEERILPSIYAVRSAQWTRVMSAIDWLHSPVLACWVLGGTALFCWRKQWCQLALMYCILLGGGIISRVAKMLIRRDRPELDILLGASGYSFPSGHVIGVMLFAVWAIYILLNSRVSIRWRLLCSTAAVYFVLLVGASRVYMGVHYPSDIIGSILAGAAWGSACIAGYIQLKVHYSRWNDHA